MMYRGNTINYINSYFDKKNAQTITLKLHSINDITPESYGVDSLNFTDLSYRNNVHPIKKITLEYVGTDLSNFTDGFIISNQCFSVKNDNF